MLNLEYGHVKSGMDPDDLSMCPQLERCCGSSELEHRLGSYGDQFAQILKCLSG